MGDGGGWTRTDRGRGWSESGGGEHAEGSMTLCLRWEAGLRRRWMRCEREDRGRGRVEGGAGGGLWKGRELPFLGDEVILEM